MECCMHVERLREICVRFVYIWTLLFPSVNRCAWFSCGVAAVGNVSIDVTLTVANVY